MPSDNTTVGARENRVDASADEVASEPVRIWSMAAPAVNALGWTLVGLAIVVRAGVTLFGTFYWDDFTLQGRAARLPLDWSFLIYSHDGHVMPIGALIAWLTERFAPLEFWLPALTMIVLQAATAVAAWLLLRRIFGARPLVILPTMAILFSAMTLPGSVWWAAALNSLPMQLGMLGVTWGAWLIQREGRERAGRIWIVASVIVSLGFFEKSLFVGLWLVLAMWLLADRPSVRVFVKGQWRDRRWLWIGLAVAAGAYVAFYTVVSDRGTALPSSFGGFLTAVLSAVFVAVLPSLIGGPVSWTPIGFGAALASPGGLVGLIAVIAVVSLIVFAWRYSRRGVYAWTAAGIYLLFVTVLMSMTRLANTDSSIGMAGMRYTADAVLPLTLAVGMSVMPIVGDRESERLTQFRLRLRARPSRLATWVVLIMIVVTFFSVRSTAGFTVIWSQISSKSWLANARTSLAAGASDGAILDQQVPGFVIWGLAFPYSDASWVLAPLPDRPDFGQYTNNPRYLMRDGRLVAGEINGIVSKPGPTPKCGWASDGGKIVIEMTGSAFEWEHQLQLDYISTGTAAASVQLGSGRVVPVEFIGGLHRMVATVEGGGTQVTVGDVQPGQRVCIGTAVVGQWKEQDTFGR